MFVCTLKRPKYPQRQSPPSVFSVEIVIFRFPAKLGQARRANLFRIRISHAYDVKIYIV